MQMKNKVLVLFASLAMSLATLVPSANMEAYDFLSRNLKAAKAADLASLPASDFANMVALKKKCHRLKNAPPYISSVNGFPEMQFAIIKRTNLISPELLCRTIEAIKIQVERDFGPYYGIEAKFHFFEDESRVDFGKFVPIFLVDFLETPVPGVIAFHNIQDSTEQNGVPISILIENAPALPDGTPYIIMPMGNADSGYGVLWAFLNFQGDPTLPPTFDGIFSWTQSHEVLETLHNYAVNEFYAINFFDNEGNLEVIELYLGEVCDPVTFTPGYQIHDTYVADFVFPNFWVPTLQNQRPYNFLDTVTAPLTPYAGLLTFYALDRFGSQTFQLISPFNDPNNLLLNLVQILFSCDPIAPQARDLRRMHGVHPVPSTIKVTPPTKEVTYF